MKRLRRISIFIVILCLVAGASVFAACNNKKATLTLDTGDNGVLSFGTMDVEAGAKLTDVLKDVVPETESGVTFAGWFLGDREIAESDLMPEEGLTVTAKYNATYTVKVYYSDAEGNFSNEPSQTQTGVARLGEPFTVETETIVGKGFLDSQKSRLSTNSLGKNEVFSVYVTLTYVRINYNVNILGSNAKIAPTDVTLGEEVVLADGNDFGLDRSLRFAGWSTTPTGAVEYELGDKFDTNSMKGYSTTLYAQWENGISDLLGGDDYLFVSTLHDGVVYLHRRGLVEKEGVYNKTTGVFSFSEGSETKLDGKIENGMFYYFEKLTNRTAVNGASDNDDEIVFNGSNNLTYRYTPEGSSDKVSVNGTYEMDFFAGEYVFISDNVATDNITFHFSLTKRTVDGVETLIFNRTNSAEAGFYYYHGANSDSVLYLDGMRGDDGIAGAIVYNVNNGVMTGVIRGFYYEWTDEMIVGDDVKDFYLFDDETTYVLVNSRGTKMFLFRIKDGNIEGVDDLEVEVRGSYLVSDGVDGSYFKDIFFDEEPSLLLDGFGKALKKDPASGEYEPFDYDLKMLSIREMANGAISNWDDFWIELDAEGSKEYIRLGSADGMLIFSEISEPPHMIPWATAVEKVYYDGQTFDCGYIYDTATQDVQTGNELVYILGQRTDEQGAYYIVLDWGAITDNADGTFRFTSTYYTDALTNFWDFRYKDGAVETSVAGAINFTATGAEELSVDKWGTLTYKGQSFDYDKWSVSYYEAYRYLRKDGTYSDLFLLEYYRVEMDGKAVVIPVRADVTQTVVDGSTVNSYERTVLAKDPTFELVWKTYYGQDNAFDRMYIFDDNKAAIAKLHVDGVYRFMVYGTVAETGEGEFKFTADPELFDGFVAAIQDEELAEFYREFNFKYIVEGEQALKYIYTHEYSAADGSRFDLDGYGNAVYTPADGDAINGTYEEIDFYEFKYYYAFTSDDGKTNLFITVSYDKEGNAVDFVAEEEENCLYYLMVEIDGEFGFYNNDYIVLLQDGTVIFYGYGVGTYEVTGAQFKYLSDSLVWTEYRFVFSDEEPVPDESGNIEGRINIIAADVPFNNGDGTQTVYRLFTVQKTPQANRNFVVEGGGRVVGDGYNDSYFTDGNRTYYGLIGIGNIRDDTPIQSNTRWKNDFQDGTQVIFMASYYVQNGEYVSYEHDFLFDKKGNTLTLRDDYTGTRAFYDKGNVTKQTMYLDGYGNATLYDENGLKVDAGTYSAVFSLNCFLFTSTEKNGKNFRFNFATMDFVDELWDVYYIVEDEVAYVNDDWSVLFLGSYHDDETMGEINGMYVDDKGVAKGGFYSLLTDDVVRFEFTDGTFGYYDLLDGNKFQIDTDEFIVRDGVLVGYQGPTTILDLKIPNEVKAIGANAFASVQHMGGSTYTLDFNNVERIEDYAFYNMLDFAYTYIASDKVLYVGDYSFYAVYHTYATVTEVMAFSWINSVSFPNATYIGDYAFSGCNQMCTGTVTLGKVTYIGAYAFSHNAFASGEKMSLDLTDLTAEQIAAISMDRNAFLAGPGTDMADSGLPVIIWVRDQAAKDATSEWFEDIQKCVQIKEASISGVAYFDFVSRNAIVFGDFTDDGIGEVTCYTFDPEKKSYSEDGSRYTYNYVEYGVVKFMTSDGTELFRFDDDSAELTIEDVTYKRSDVLHTFAVTDESNKVVDFSFIFRLDLSYGVDLEVTYAIYDKHSVQSMSMDNTDYCCNVKYEDTATETVYNTTVNFADWTSQSIPYGITVESQDYVGLLEDPIAGGYRYLTLSKKASGGEEELLFEDARRADINLWQVVVLQENEQITYTVNYNPATNRLDVQVETVATVTCQSENGTYEAVFTQKDNIAQSLAKLSKKSDQGDYYESIYDVRQPSFGTTAVKTGDNEFTLTINANGITVWKIVCNLQAKTITVTESFTKVVRNIESAHDESAHENYYVLALYVDEDGNVVGISELALYVYRGNGYSQDGVYFSLIDVQMSVDGDARVFTGTYGDETYTITVRTSVQGGETVYNVTVSKS